mmetsp:Transcript_33577/g.6096  ORF Transcript_33577/g.6096 Transcript_33577/m.6096 type:complete len:122 (+) Transcript_33577:19-384(+)
MVVHTEQCSFSEMKIWPGRGSRIASRDGKVFIFLNHKAKCFHRMKVKPVKLTWTQNWRRMNKKVKKSDLDQKVKVRRRVKVEKAVAGVTMEELNKKRNERPEVRASIREQAKREIEERKKK